MALVMSGGIFREESLRRYRDSSTREDVPLTIRTRTLVALWAVVVLLMAAGVVFALVLRTRMGGGA
ncbi:hypothetical protein [Streptosporangium carneum]|uniref:Uncharacterized protein n=1 Tax=Streptosporangium carneum TaxID=47481 RepID=A0A9W6MDD2_9ACTN|nr:hypothetical protein [Streptosporangium carneum]GLK09805.1 hypothetical protein GCM10017600_32110 [Streptosporangium carneum]